MYIESIPEEYHHAVIIAGNGHAALNAAFAASEKGAMVKVFDQDIRKLHGRSSRLTAAVMRVAFDHPEMVEVQIKDEHPATSNDTVPALPKAGSSLVDWIINNSNTSLLWLANQGVRLQFADKHYSTTAYSAEQIFSGGLVIQAASENGRLIDEETATLQEQGIALNTETQLVDLIQHDGSGAVVGAVIEDASGKQWLEFGRVILGASGFVLNRQMLKTCMGDMPCGLSTNSHGQVLNENDKPVEGLYACGSSYMPFYVAGQGLINGDVAGMFAGQHAAKSHRKETDSHEV